MNYYELFEVEPGISFSKKELTRQYFILQKKYHPDYYAQADDDEKASVEQMSTMVNEAYKVLQQDDLALKYFLQLHNYVEEEEKYALAPDFLMEVMELNELKMEDADAKEIEAKAMELLATIKKPVNHWLTGKLTLPAKEEELKALKNYYYQKKYIDRLLAD